MRYDRNHRHAVRVAAAAATLAVLLAGCARPATHTAAGVALTGPETGAFIARLGDDTVAVERYTLTENKLEGDIVSRSPARIAHYVVALSANGMPTRADLTVRRPDGSVLPNQPQSASLIFTNDSAVSVVLRDTAITRRIAARSALPSVTLSYALVELGLRALVASGRDSADIVMLPFGAQSPNVFPTKLVRPDAVRITWLGGFPQHVRIDRAGRILSLDGTPTTFKVRVDRLPNADVGALASAFAAAEQAGRRVSISSPRDTVRATIGRANLLVDYGRPFRRGRTIFGGIVPFDTIWRTGANAATQFRTDVDLLVGGATIPAGTYTLWTVPSRNGPWQLVVNKQTGQWGTVYDPKQDLTRISLRTETVATPVDQFTISIEPQGAGGLLSLAWDRTRASVPFTVR